MNVQSKATEKWQKANGYMVKGFKLKRDLVEKFEKACEADGKSQAAVITEFMNGYIKEKGIQ